MFLRDNVLVTGGGGGRQGIGGKKVVAEMVLVAQEREWVGTI